MLVVLVAVFYFLLIRPENKRKKKAQEMRDSLKKGDTITTIGGIVGKIVHGQAGHHRHRDQRRPGPHGADQVGRVHHRRPGLAPRARPAKEDKKKEDEVKASEEIPEDRRGRVRRPRGRGKEGLTHHKSTLPCHMLG